jgi:hypothetical protein
VFWPVEAGLASGPRKANMGVAARERNQTIRPHYQHRPLNAALGVGRFFLGPPHCQWQTVTRCVEEEIHLRNLRGMLCFASRDGAARRRVRLSVPLALTCFAVLLCLFNGNGRRRDVRWDRISSHNNLGALPPNGLAERSIRKCHHATLAAMPNHCRTRVSVPIRRALGVPCAPYPDWGPVPPRLFEHTSKHTKHLQHETFECNIRTSQMKYLEHTIATCVKHMQYLDKTLATCKLKTLIAT